jgi:hypothetical protein
LVVVVVVDQLVEEVGVVGVGRCHPVISSEDGAPGGRRGRWLARVCRWAAEQIPNRAAPRRIKEEVDRIGSGWRVGTGFGSRLDFGWSWILEMGRGEETRACVRATADVASLIANSFFF